MDITEESSVGRLEKKRCESLTTITCGVCQPGTWRKYTMEVEARRANWSGASLPELGKWKTEQMTMSRVKETERVALRLLCKGISLQYGIFYLMLLTMTRPAVAAKNTSYSPTTITAAPWCKSLIAEWNGVYDLKNCQNSDNENEWGDINGLHCIGRQFR